jgi:hypothetical protein
MQPPGTFVLDSLYRQNDKDREASIAKWRAWRLANH